MKHKQEIRKGFEWFRTLSKKQQKRFRLETHKQRGLERFHDVMNASSYRDTFLMTGFILSDSKHGIDYWNRLIDNP